MARDYGGEEKDFKRNHISGVKLTSLGFSKCSGSVCKFSEHFSEITNLRFNGFYRLAWQRLLQTQMFVCETCQWLLEPTCLRVKSTLKLFSDQSYRTENCLWRGSRNLMDLSQVSKSNPLRAFGHHIKTVLCA